MPDKITRRLERLEKQAEERGELIDVTEYFTALSEVYHTQTEKDVVIMRLADWQAFTDVLLTVYGKN